MTQHVITVVCGSNPEIDEAAFLAAKLQEAGLVADFRPAVSMVYAIEVIPVGNQYREAIKQEFRNAGFECPD